MVAMPMDRMPLRTIIGRPVLHELSAEGNTLTLLEHAVADLVLARKVLEW